MEVKKFSQSCLIPSNKLLITGMNTLSHDFVELIFDPVSKLVVQRYQSPAIVQANAPGKTIVSQAWSRCNYREQRRWYQLLIHYSNITLPTRWIILVVRSPSRDMFRSAEFGNYVEFPRRPLGRSICHIARNLIDLISLKLLLSGFNICSVSCSLMESFVFECIFFHVPYCSEITRVSPSNKIVQELCKLCGIMFFQLLLNHDIHIVY